MIQSVLRQWMRELGGELPRDYFCFDQEFSGFSFGYGKQGNSQPASSDDLVWELGHCDVIDCRAQDYEWTVIDWTTNEFIEEGFLRNKLAEHAYYMGRRGLKPTMTWERMASEGVPAREALDKYMNLLEAALLAGKPIVGFNLARCDRRIFADVTEEWAGTRFEIPKESIFDVGAVEKASQAEMPPLPGETLAVYFTRVGNTPRPGIKFSMDYCVRKYKLLEKYGVNPADTHSAGFDAMVSHLLTEEFRTMLEAQDAQ